ncbi:urease accessory protein UreD [Actinoplanes flavus]|uniref:Urease accessory protein UreD n=1 Tax=Actinoplanes flavus TaxID=2820290 RepID=A0ABS3UQN1_9ACTN|nr:urease accessory protein UreD [Actinoplanes flavus]MBO3741081.1 urease accessory protein UreD [Actinoplanes flavus]
MRASAAVVAETDGRGGTRLAVLRGESPLLPRRTGPRSAGGATVHLVGGAAGPLRGDDLRLDIEVGPGATLEMFSVAASLALPGRPGPPSRLTITARVAAGATLRWLPEPLIAAAGCDHVAVTRVEVAAGGTLLWRDDLVCGRHGEPSGAVRADTTIRYAGVTLHRHELAVGPGAPGWDGAAVLGGGRAVGTLVAAGPGLPNTGMAGLPNTGMAGLPGAGVAGLPDTGVAGLPDTGVAGLPDTGVAGPNAAVMPMAGPGVLATAVGADIREVRAALDPLCRRPAVAF